MKRKSLILICSLLLVTSFCHKKVDTKGIALNLKVSPAALTDTLFVRMDYSFTTTDAFQKVTPDYKVFVHFWRVRTRQMLLQDDHDLVKPTSQWQKGEKLSYSRTLFIPPFLNEFDNDFEGFDEVKVTVGLYNPAPGSKDKPIILYEQKVKVEPASAQAPEIAYDEGWNDLETDPQSSDPFSKNWRWTTARAVCVIENPKKEYTLMIRGGVDKGVAPDQKVIFKINDVPLDDFVPPEGKFAKEYTLTPAQMGDKDLFNLTIETDKTFVPSQVNPASKDNRQLGIQVYFLYFREKI